MTAPSGRGCQASVDHNTTVSPATIHPNGVSRHRDGDDVAVAIRAAAVVSVSPTVVGAVTGRSGAVFTWITEGQGSHQ